MVIQTKPQVLPPFTLKLFSPDRLRTEDGLQAARLFLDSFLLPNDIDATRVLFDNLCQEPPHLFEFTVAIIMDQPRYDIFYATLHQNISFTNAYLNSLSFAVGERIRSFCIRVLSIETPYEFNEYHREFEKFAKVLRVISSMDFTEPGTPLEEETFFNIRGKQSQKHLKRLKRRREEPSVDPAPVFAAIKTEVPASQEEASVLGKYCVEELQDILECYLTFVRNPKRRTAFRSLYITEDDQPAVALKEDFTVPKEEPTTASTSDGAQLESFLQEPEPEPEPEDCAAYPHIQPLKAARYFSEPAKGFGPWPLILASRAIQHLKNYRREDQKIWNVLRTKLEQLSDGFFSDDNQKPLSGVSQDIPIYEAKATRDLRIIYQIVVVPDDETGNDHQVIRIWGIHTHAQMDKRLWTAITKHQGRLGSEYRRRCLFRATPKSQGKNVIYPYSWTEVVPKISDETIADDGMDTENQLELHAILTHEKFMKMSQSLLNDIITDQDATHPFVLTREEQEIRDHGSSCFVLGRSGTGKTTTMVFKMMNLEELKAQRASQVDEAALTMPPQRQLFVTQSRILARRVQEYFEKMLSSSVNSRKAVSESEEAAPESKKEQDHDDMMDLDDEDDEERADLPKKFCELEDRHFPLFLTVDQLCRLLEGDCNLTFKRGPRTREHRRAEQWSHTAVVDKDMDVADEDEDFVTDQTSAAGAKGSSLAQSSMVTYDTFLYAYWAHLPQTLTKGLDPGLVYNEFLGVIKGSEGTLAKDSDENWLDRETYLNLSERQQFTFAKQRGRIYDLFERYNKIKAARGDYDAADRTHAILRACRGKLPLKWKVNYLYVDEVQDNLIIDARLLRLICGNPHGLFWAGDTAQTISMGSSFRFDDLKAFIYRLEEKEAAGRDPVHPKSFHLAVNYRSHAGVVNCAHSVVELITQFWPHSIDVLPRERGLVPGPPPMLFVGWDTEDASYEQFFFHESLNIELGAQQCILVRNDQVRENLRRQIGDVGLILTMYEAKGLEFNDVLLYNFFSDSTVPLAEWRVILNKVDEKTAGRGNVPKFDDAKHASLCSELKSLYVGITRAREHVWILDASEKSEPMNMFWQSRGLVNICRPGDRLPKLAAKSTPEQWARQGHTLFKQKLFKHALQCFENADMTLEKSIAFAYLLRQNAKQHDLQHGRTQATLAAYTQAADQFFICANLSVLPDRRTKYFTVSARMFSSAGQNVKAAQTYFTARQYTEAAIHFKQARLYDEAADVILGYKNEVEPKVAGQCIDLARVYLHREGNLQRAARLFDGVEEHLEYLEDFGFENSKVALLRTLERWHDLAQVYIENGSHLDAIPYLLRGNEMEARTEAVHCLLEWLWRNFPLGIAAKPSDTESQQLKKIFQQLESDTRLSQSQEFSVFRAIIDGDTGLLKSLARSSTASPSITLLCLDRILNSPPALQNASAEDISKCLEDYLRYAELMQSVIANWDTIASTKVLTLLADDESAQFWTVFPKSILYQVLKDSGIEDSDEPVTVNRDRIQQEVGRVLGNRMRRRMVEENQECLRAKAFQPCLNFVINGVCHRNYCPRDHVARGSLDTEHVNLRIRIHLQQILLIHRIAVTVDSSIKDAQRVWVERFYNTLLPPHSALGNPSVLVPRYIPEYGTALSSLCFSIMDQFFSLKASWQYGGDIKLAGQFVTDFVRLATLAYTFNRANADDYIWRSKCITTQLKPEALLLRKEENATYIPLALLEFFQGFTLKSIIHGASFIRHVLHRQIPVDIDVLMNLIESVAGSAVLASRKSVHQLTLPRSWIINLLRNGTPLGEATCTPRVLCHFTDSFPKLMEGLISGEGLAHMTHEGHQISSKTPQIPRSILLWRLCRCMALTGYNVRSHLAIREDIVRLLQSLGESLRTPLTSQYVNPRNWQDVVRAMRQSLDSPLDDLVALYRATEVPPNPPKGIRIVQYKFETDILPTLEYGPTVKFNPEAAPFIPKSLQQKPEQTAEEEEEPDEESGSIQQFVPDEDSKDVPNDRSVQLTQHELEAAEAIWEWYRNSHARKNQKAVVSADTARFHSECVAQATTMEMTRRYRMMYLGPLPHVLAVVYRLGQMILKEKKRHNKAHLQSDVEQFTDLSTKYKNVHKRQLSLLKTLDPKSKFHLEASCDELKEKVEEAKQLLEEGCSILKIGDLREDMTMGYKGISQTPAPPRAEKRCPLPSLNTEDIYQF